MADKSLLENVKEYLRVDGDHDDKTLGLLIDSAKEYLLNAGAKEQDSKTYTLAIIMLVTHWFENREQVVGQTANNLTLGLQSIILQLKVGDPSVSSQSE